ncbi:MAG: excinuclease ABC subunit UvrA [Spirochaetales bacterium]|nr:excinuclease ABC subunit UvrA [Spirochaetales bacterium]
MNTIISIHGARENNLKNIDVIIPREHLTVCTGVSGSGKSTLVHDILYREGQRKLLETMGQQSKRYISQGRKADFDFVHGLSPVIAIDQKKGVVNPRSYVGTITEIDGYLRVLFANIAQSVCPVCGEPFDVKKITQIGERIANLPDGVEIRLYKLMDKIYGENYAYLLDHIRQKGISRVRIDGIERSLSDDIELVEEEHYLIEALYDNFVKGEIKYDAMIQILKSVIHGQDRRIRIELAGKEVSKKLKDSFFEGLACPRHHYLTGELLPYYFSPNDSDSACHTCKGLGTTLQGRPEFVVSKPHKSLGRGAIDNGLWSVLHPNRYMLLYSMALHYGFSMSTPFEDLPQHIQDVILYGTKGEKFILVEAPDKPVKYRSDIGKAVAFEGMVTKVDNWYRWARNRGNMKEYETNLFKRLMAEYICPDCGGTGLRNDRLAITIDGRNIHAVRCMEINDVRSFISGLEGQKQVKTVIEELLKRLDNLIELGLGYINLGRKSDSLSGGEYQRIRLSTQINSGLLGMLYILDEPSIGLHQRDISRIITAMRKLQGEGNTVVVIEHDLETIKSADYLVELGPGPGEKGGEVLFAGTSSEITGCEPSIIAPYISGAKSIAVPNVRRKGNGWICIRGARENNLKRIDVAIPLSTLTCITGVSGSGKSTLINDILYYQAFNEKYKRIALHSGRQMAAGKHDRIEGLEQISDIISIDQSPIGKTSMSTPATYIGLFDRIRKLFADTDEAREQGFSITEFSQFSTGGRCPECGGHGYIITKLYYMPDIKSHCPVCEGKRYNENVLMVKYKGKTINDVLNMTLSEAKGFFDDIPYLRNKLNVLCSIGLGYIALGQHSNTLSGGESQRIKLATELSKRKRQRSLYILDEPTTGLHIEDIKLLLKCLNRIVDRGNTVIVIEHNLDLIKSADHIVDLGPEGGKGGGMVVAEGTPEQVAGTRNSYTGVELRKVLDDPLPMQKRRKKAIA